MGVARLTGVFDMTNIRERRYLLVVFALALALVGCKAESPTAPSGGTGGGGTGSGGGGITPPTGAAVVLAVSNPNPLVDSTTVLTATVTQNSTAVPNGTAVEFSTNLGTFTDTGTTTTIRTTTGGAATATLTSSSPGTATVLAVVNNVSRSATVNFGARPVTPVPPDLTPAITGVSPTSGRPQGGQTLIITGRNFRGPVRVLFDIGIGTPKEGFVVSVSPTQIEVLTPPVDLGAGQTKNANISVIFEAGTPTESRVSATTPFVYTAETLTPKVNAASPASGPTTGGTRVTLFGEGFQAPLQVFFGNAEAQVLNITFSQVIVMAPPSRDTSGDGSSSVTGPVDVRVVNINSGTSTTFTAGYRYTPGMSITAVGPTEGPATGGTRVTIDGTGFDDPVAVVIGGVAAQVIRVSGSQIVAITSPVEVTGCAEASGPVTVTNVETGVTADGPAFRYRTPKPIILSATPNVALGGAITVVVANAAGIPRLTLGTTNLNITGAVANPNGTTTFTANVPTTTVLTTQACAAVPGVSVPSPTVFDVTYTSMTTGCTDTLTSGTTVTPAATAVFASTPAAFAPFSAKFNPATIAIPVASVTPSAAQTLTVTNSGTAPLSITAVTYSAGCSAFQITTGAVPATLATCEAFPITAIYTGPTPAASGSNTCVVTLTTPTGSRGYTLSGLTQ